MRLLPSTRTRLRVASPLPVDVLVPSLDSGLSSAQAPRVLPGRSGPFVMTGEVWPDGQGAQVRLRVQGTLVLPLTPTFEGVVRPGPRAGSVVEGDVVEHGLVRGYLRALWVLPAMLLGTVLLALVLSGPRTALYGLGWSLLGLPLAIGLQHLWLGFVRLLYRQQDAQLREYLTTCCQAVPQQVRTGP